MGSEPMRLGPFVWILGVCALWPASSHAFRTMVPQASRSLSFLPWSRASTQKQRKWSLSSTKEEEEWYPHDPAWSTPQLLEGIWSQIALAKNLMRGVRGLRFDRVLFCSERAIHLFVSF